MVSENDSSEYFQGDWYKCHKNVVIVGDGGCGKTCLFNAYNDKDLPSYYIPTSFDTCMSEMSIDDITYEVSLTDTAGEEAYDRLRPLAYPNTDIIILCFSVDSRTSFCNLYDKWILEVLHFCPNVPVVLVCTKVDLRNDVETVAKLARIKQHPITETEGKKLAKDIGAIAYVECSARARFNVNEVFKTAIKSTLNKRKYSRQLKKMKQLRKKYKV